MKTKLILILILFSASSTLFSQITFSHTNISNAKTQATASNLPYFVYISADWCLPCQIMEETTFKSLDLKDAIDQKYTAYKVDFHSEAGAEWVAAHDLCCLPTFLFFNEQGDKIQEIQSPLTASGFMKVLESPQSYSKTDKNFANANSSERLRSQVSPRTKTESNKENLGNTLAATRSTVSQQNPANFTTGMGNYYEYNSSSSSENMLLATSRPTNISKTNTIRTEDIKNEADFLNDLRKHIASLESVYAKYETEDENAVKIKNVSPLAKMEGFTSETNAKSDCECENIVKNAEELAQTIKELKNWEVQLGTLTEAPSPVPINTTTAEFAASPTFVSNTYEASVYYSVQMGMFKTESYARRMVDDLAKSYTYSIEMKTVEKSGNILHRVLLGPFRDEAEAKEAYVKMKEDGRKAVVGIF